MKVLHIFVITSAIFAIGESLQCYECFGCEEPFNSEKTTVKKINCTAGEESSAICSKSHIEMANGTEVYVRRCDRKIRAASSYDQGPSMRVDNYITATHIFYCLEDYCNGAQSLYSPLWMLMIGVTCIFSLAHGRY